MGLNVTHGCWEGAYSAFRRWREKLSEVAGFGDLSQREGFGGNVPWPENDPLVVILDHSDCDGDIHPDDCDPLADALEQILPAMDRAGDGHGHLGAYGAATRKWIAGLRLAAKNGQFVEFK